MGWTDCSSGCEQTRVYSRLIFGITGLCSGILMSLIQKGFLAKNWIFHFFFYSIRSVHLCVIGNVQLDLLKECTTSIVIVEGREHKFSAFFQNSALKTTFTYFGTILYFSILLISSAHFSRVFWRIDTYKHFNQKKHIK